MALLFPIFVIFSAPVAAQGEAPGVEQAGAPPAEGLGRDLTYYFIGQVRQVFGDYCPHGALPADGRLLDIASNRPLFALIGCQFGGDCTTQFGLPDLRARTLVGTGASNLDPHVYRLGEYGGEPRPLTEYQMPSHSHDVFASQGAPNTGSPRGALPPTRTDGLNAFTSEMSADEMTPFGGQSVTSTGGGAAFNPYHPVLVVTHCVQVLGNFPQRQ